MNKEIIVPTILEHTQRSIKLGYRTLKLTDVIRKYLQSIVSGINTDHCSEGTSREFQFRVEIEAYTNILKDWRTVQPNQYSDIVEAAYTNQKDKRLLLSDIQKGSTPEYVKKYNVPKREFYAELVANKYKTESTNSERFDELLYKLCMNLSPIVKAECEDDIFDACMHAYVVLFQKWHTFDETISPHAFAYCTRTAVNGIFEYFNKQKKSVQTHSLDLILTHFTEE